MPNVTPARRSLLSRARETLRLGLDRRASTAAAEPAYIDELVSPLRYDVVVRAQYFAFLADRLELFSCNFGEFERQALEHPYFTWFSKVALIRYRPQVASDEQRVREAYRERLHRSTRLYRAYQARGFDTRFPISLRVAAPGAVSNTGKPVRQRFFPGDGCHRLALVMLSGERQLPAAYYRVRNEPLHVLTDNTYALLGPLALPPAEYYRYLSRGYADGTHSDRESLLRHVGVHNPERLAELEQVIAADADRLAGPPATTGDPAAG